MMNNLEGRTLNILAMKNENFLVLSKNNETGAIVATSGILSFIINWISRKYLFNYVIIRDIESRMEDVPGDRGIISYVLSGEADLVLGAIFPAIQIYNRLDFTTSWLDSPLSILIPNPENSINFVALIQPFSFLVWVLLAATTVASLIALYTVSSIWANTFSSAKISHRKNVGAFTEFSGAYDYISSVFLSQGGWCSANVLAVRLVAGVWCVGCFVLIQSYSSTLISYVLSPRISPIINSVEDILRVPGLQITVDRGRSIETSILKADNGVLKYLGDILRENSHLRCNKTEDCVREVRKGRHVYINGAPVVQGIVASDRKITGSCHFSIAKESFWPSPIVFGIPKGSMYGNFINKGLMQLRENGLLYYWKDEFLPNPRECIENYKEKPSNPRLQIVNLTAAFVILVGGYLISLVSFFAEKAITIWSSRKRQKN